MIQYKRKQVLIGFLVAVCVLFLAMAGFAQSETKERHHEENADQSKEEHHHGEDDALEANVVNVTVTGKNFCLGCALKKEQGAKAQCSIFGHKHVLRVEKAVDAEGKDLPEMKGQILHYLETETSNSLINEHHKETVTIKGKVYSTEGVVEVESFEIPKETPAKAEKLTSQTSCPIKGGKINKDLYVDHDGKRVYLCCGECVISFKKDSAKYIAKMQKAGVALADIPPSK